LWRGATKEEKRGANCGCLSFVSLFAQKTNSPNADVAMVLIQVFSGNLALFGLITAMILSQGTYACVA